MIVKKTLSLRRVYEFAGYHVWWLSGWMLLVAGFYYFTDCGFILPGLPLALVGTAVAFYVGFKNSHSYDRLWGGIKIWSAFVNDSRKLASMLKHYRNDDAPADDKNAALRMQIIFHHIAYLYILREQLLEPTQWEHVSVNDVFGTGRCNRRRRNQLNKLYKAELEEVTNRRYLSEEERTGLIGFNNKAVQLLDKQTETIQLLYECKAINMIQQIELQDTISRFYDTQGNAERIKLSPFPRKYASFSFLFICIFIFLLPFGLIGEFSKLGNAGMWLSVPVGAIVGWVYIAMEMVGDYSENPFEGLHNDAPMLADCSRLINSRQSCVAAKRFIVEESVIAPFTQLFLEKMKSKVIGNPLEPGTDVGPQARQDLRDELHSQVMKSIEKGAKCIPGGTVTPGNHAFYPPTILTNISF